MYDNVYLQHFWIVNVMNSSWIHWRRRVEWSKGPLKHDNEVTRIVILLYFPPTYDDCDNDEKARVTVPAHPAAVFNINDILYAITIKYF